MFSAGILRPKCHWLAFHGISECDIRIDLMYFTDEGEIWLNVPNLPSGTGKLTIDDHWVASSLEGHSRQALVLITNYRRSIVDGPLLTDSNILRMQWLLPT